MITPTDKQRDFIESNLPRLTWETSGRGAGGTTALVLAAMRDMCRTGYCGLLLCAAERGHIGWFNYIARILDEHAARPQSPSVWVSAAGGTLALIPASHAFTQDFDFIGIDDVEYLGLPRLKEIVKHLRPGGRLRCTRDTQRLDELLGARMPLSAMNPHLDPAYVERLALSSKPPR